MATTQSDDLNKVLDSLEQSEESSTPAAQAPAAMDYESPTLASLDGKRRPNPLPICAACPQSLWFASAQSVQCYCRLMHVVTWATESPAPILQCDGPVLSRE